MDYMFIRNYILTTIRLVIAKWWLSLIKILSLTLGILSFLLIWLFYVDHQYFTSGHDLFVQTCSSENLTIFGSILLVTSGIYFFILRSQMQLRYKEFFLRKFYGETRKGVVTILFMETTLFIAAAFVLSLVLVDQVAPVFNIITSKSVDIQAGDGTLNFIVILSFLVLLGSMVGLVPSLWCARKRAIDVLKKLPK